ncbi:hypothetical protein DENIS_2521 [Desulfonema ishimotonii]|uniref:Uncharacterized protein n=1 Tax=Desulfonema ishimotonii TaxID=45657 RepID=A0A401FX82_9BACT|nr:hypothetical protein [Desulfonema ishimotonii]GBC61559.1 hypothetical protein DENIS_2521 [Desulfonema ishimotonii]
MEILDILSATIEEAEEILESSTDPTNQYIDILDKLLFMKELIQEIKAGKAPYDEKKIEEYSRKIREIEANIKNAVDEVFSSDIFFGLGEYEISELSDKGKEELKQFTKTIIELQVKNFRKLFPDRPLVIIIRAIGYADETPPGPELSEILRSTIATPLPEDSAERKKMLNSKLSFLRAQSISEYIRIQLKNTLEIENVIIGDPEIEGLGEELPYSGESFFPPYRSQDERRRICKIYSKITLDIPIDLSQP